MKKDPRDVARENFVASSRGKRPGIVKEFLSFLSHNKKWWLLPILVVLLLFGVLIILGGSAAGPFIYPLF